MAQKLIAAWSRFHRKSASLRRSFEQLTTEFAQLALAENADAIRGSAVAKVEMEGWRQVLNAAAQTTERATGAMEKRASEALEGLEEQLVRTLREAGLSVYGETSLLVIEGIVHADVDIKKAIVQINGRVATDMSLDGLKGAIVGELDRVRKLVTSPEKFLPLLLRAYEAERLQAEKEFGAQVQTSALLWQLTMLRQQPGFRSNPVAANFREYPREIFRADLSRLLESDLTSVDGKRFRQASGSDTAGAVFMFVPQLGRTAHVGRIWFEHGSE
jgi:hypothetical protein